MKRSLTLALLLCSPVALADNPAPQAVQQAAKAATAEAAAEALPAAPEAMDMSKMGPWTRKPTNLRQTKKEVRAMFKAMDEHCKSGKFDEVLKHVSFPVQMITDNSKGVPSSELWDQATYMAVMKPFWENMPKEAKMIHRPSITVLSDSLVAVTDAYTMKMGKKQKLKGTNAGLLVKEDGVWKWKVMTEAGWGDMPTPKT